MKGLILKMNIVVLCGGLCMERDVSIASGEKVAGALRDRGHKAVLIDLYLGYIGEYKDPLEVFDRPHDEDSRPVKEKAPDLEAVKALRKQDNDSKIGDNVLEICRAADIVFLALHGEEGENGKLQAVLDIEGIRYTGSGYMGSALAMDKHLTKQLLGCAGIQTPPGILIKRSDKEFERIGFPCVVKPCSGGSSVGTSIVREEDDYDQAVRLALQFEDKAIVERYIKGRELTVGIIDRVTMPVLEVIPKTGFYDYKNKYQAGLTQELCPAPLDEKTAANLKEQALRIMEILMIEAYCRVDFLLDDEGETYCLEANTLPGMTPVSLIPRMGIEMGMDFGSLCEWIIEVSMEKYA